PFLGAFEGAAGLLLGARLLHAPDELRQALRGAVVGDVQAVDGFGEAEVGVDAGDDDPHVDGEDLDAYQRNPGVDVDDQSLFEDEVDDVGEAAAGAASSLDGAGARGLLGDRPSHVCLPVSGGRGGVTGVSGRAHATSVPV